MIQLNLSVDKQKKMTLRIKFTDSHNETHDFNRPTLLLLLIYILIIRLSAQYLLILISLGRLHFLFSSCCSRDRCLHLKRVAMAVCGHQDCSRALGFNGVRLRIGFKQHMKQRNKAYLLIQYTSPSHKEKPSRIFQLPSASFSDPGRDSCTLGDTLERGMEWKDLCARVQSRNIVPEPPRICPVSLAPRFGSLCHFGPKML